MKVLTVANRFVSLFFLNFFTFQSNAITVEQLNSAMNASIDFLETRDMAPSAAAILAVGSGQLYLIMTYMNISDEWRNRLTTYSEKINRKLSEIKNMPSARMKRWQVLLDPLATVEGHQFSFVALPKNEGALNITHDELVTKHTPNKLAGLCDHWLFDGNNRSSEKRNCFTGSPVCGQYLTDGKVDPSRVAVPQKLAYVEYADILNCSNYNNEKLILTYCAYSLRLVTTIAEQGIPDSLKDYFLNDMLYCTARGLKMFLLDKYFDEIITWQNADGSVGPFDPMEQMETVNSSIDHSTALFTSMIIIDLRLQFYWDPSTAQ